MHISIVHIKDFLNKIIVLRIEVEFLKISLETFENLKKEIFTKISETFSPENFDNFAIRSSAIGEDGTEFSSAGQLNTYLNVNRTRVVFILLIF